ncbi:MAG TPA: VC0807 family protein [Streptosporangiales bacterium]
MSTSPASLLGGRDALRRLAPSIVVSGLVPLVVYAVVRPHVHDDAVALLAGATVPAAFTIGKLAWRRRLDPVGVLGVLGFGIAVLVLVASGGSPLVLKLQDAVVTGPLGVVCLASVVVGKPLHRVVFGLLARRNPAFERMLRAPGSRRSSTVITALLGATMVAHALVLLVLALSLPTASFLAASRPAGLAVLAAGVAVLVWYRNRRRRALADAERSER